MDYSTSQRRKMSKTGAAMPGGRYPIENAQDVKNARKDLHFTPPAGRPAVEAHINTEARKLGVVLAPLKSK